MSEAFNVLRKKFGNNVHLGSEAADLEFVSTGSMMLDWAAGGGFPRGRVTEIYGRESVGKTTIAYIAISAAQALDLGCIFINLEGAFNKKWARTMGVDLDKLILAEPAHGDDAAEILIEASGTPGCDLIFFDSVGAMMSEKELEDEGKDRVGGQSKMVTGMIKRVMFRAYRNDTAVVILNQARDDMRSPVPGAIESPGGRALKHACSIRMEIKSGMPYKATVDGENKQIGYRLSALVKKNQLGTPKRKVEFDFFHDAVEGHALGIDRTKEIMELAMRLQVFERTGAYYSHPLFPTDAKGAPKIQGKEAVEAFFASNPNAVTQIRSELLAAGKKTEE